MGERLGEKISVAFSLQPSRPGGVCVENIEHLPVQNLPQNPDGARPMIRQTSKGPWWKI